MRVNRKSNVVVPSAGAPMPSIFARTSGPTRTSGGGRGGQRRPRPAERDVRQVRVHPDQVQRPDSAPVTAQVTARRKNRTTITSRAPAHPAGNPREPAAPAGERLPAAGAEPCPSAGSWTARRRSCALTRCRSAVDRGGAPLAGRPPDWRLARARGELEHEAVHGGYLRFLLSRGGGVAEAEDDGDRAERLAEPAAGPVRRARARQWQASASSGAALVSPATEYGNSIAETSVALQQGPPAERGERGGQLPHRSRQVRPGRCRRRRRQGEQVAGAPGQRGRPAGRRCRRRLPTRASPRGPGSSGDLPRTASSRRRRAVPS